MSPINWEGTSRLIEKWLEGTIRWIRRPTSPAVGILQRIHYRTARDGPYAIITSESDGKREVLAVRVSRETARIINAPGKDTLEWFGRQMPVRGSITWVPLLRPWSREETRVELDYSVKK